MVKLVTTQSVTLSTPVLDRAGKPVLTKVKWNGREVQSEIHDFQRHKANEVIEVDSDVAKELVSKKLARPVEAALDDVVEVIVDPTKADPLA